MARAFVFCIIALFFAMVSAALHKDRRDADLSIGDIINVLGLGLVQDIHATITLESLTTNMIDTDFDVKNPLPIELTLDRITTSAGVNGTVFAQFSHTFPSPGLVVPPLGTKNSGTIHNVSLPQGAVASLDIIPLGVLDILDADASVRAFTIAGRLGVPIALDNLKQQNVPATYDLEV